jgi:hypothetical protein
VNDQDYKEKIKGLMKQQHKTMIKELLSGRYTGEFASDEESREPTEVTDNKNQISESLDDVLLNYIIKRK